MVVLLGTALTTHHHPYLIQLKYVMHTNYYYMLQLISTDIMNLQLAYQRTVQCIYCTLATATLALIYCLLTLVYTIRT